MPASFPSSAKSFVTREIGDTIAASHINDLQLEVAAIESDLLNATPTFLSTVTSGINATALSTGTVPLARLASANTTANGVVDTTTQSFAGGKTFSGVMTITGAATLSNTLGVTGATTLSSTLAVTGATTLTGGLNTPLVPAQGGTGLSSYAVGDLVYASGSTTLAKLADVAVGQVLVSGGVATAPAYSASPSITALTYTTSLKSTTALATPAALTATQATAFASTVSGAAIMGFGTTNDVSLLNRAGTVVLGVGPNTTTVNMTGLLTVSGFGTHTFSAGGTGANNLKVVNTTSGTTNLAGLTIDSDVENGLIQAYSSTYTSSGTRTQSALAVRGLAAGGLVLSAEHASGAIRFYSGGSTQRLSLNADGSLTFGTSSATVGMIRLPNNEFSKGRNTGNTADLSIIGVDSSNKIRIDADGTGSVMSGALSVAGSCTTSGNFIGNFPGSSYNYASVSAFTGGTISYYSSDRRLKKNIEPIGDGLAIVRQLRPSTFDLIADDYHAAGFIAQDVLGLVPGAATVTPNDGLLAFNVTGIVAFTAKAIQELDQQVTQHDTRLAVLEAKLLAAGV